MHNFNKNAYYISVAIANEHLDFETQSTGTINTLSRYHSKVLTRFHLGSVWEIKIDSNYYQLAGLRVAQHLAALS